jgi:peptide deformylase
MENKMTVEKKTEETNKKSLVTIFDSDGALALKKASNPVSLPLSTSDRDLIGDLIKYIIQENGLGMAAIQLGEEKNIFVFEKPAGTGRLQVVINPVIHSMSGKKARVENCFSVPLGPGVGVRVKRPANIVVSYHDEDGNKIERESISGQSAQIFLHEFCHLLGLTMMDSSKYGRFIEVVRLY